MPLLAQASVEILDDTPQVSDTLLPGSSGKQQRQEEAVPSENNVKEAEEQLPKSPKVGKAEVPVARKERMLKILLIVQDVLLHNSSSSEDVNHRLRRAEATSSLETPTTSPGFHDHSSTSYAAGKTSEETTAWVSYCNEATTLSKGRPTQQLLASKPVDSIDTCFRMYHEQSLTPSRSSRHSPASNCPTRIAATKTIRRRPQDRIDGARLPTDDSRYRRLESETPLHGSSWHSASLHDQDGLDYLPTIHVITARSGRLSQMIQVGVVHRLLTQTVTTESDYLLTRHTIAARSGRHHRMVQILI